jgi:hypothetical protein
MNARVIRIILWVCCAGVWVVFIMPAIVAGFVYAAFNGEMMEAILNWRKKS